MDEFRITNACINEDGEGGELVPVSDGWLVGGRIVLPRIIAEAGTRAGERFIEFFTAQIRNPHTRRAYGRAVADFCAWADEKALRLDQIRPVVVAAYVEQLTGTYAAPSVKQQLAALKMLFDWLVLGQVIPVNPAAAVRGPKHVVKKGQDPGPDRR